MPVTEPHGHTLNVAPRLFEYDLQDKILLSCHLLGKPTADQLYRLHSESVSGARAIRQIVNRLSREPLYMLSVIKPLDINYPTRFLSHVYLDTTKSRRHLEKIRNIPFKRPPELPSRDWRFLRHDITQVDELVSFELTARRHQIPFGYESHYDITGSRVYPPITIAHDDLTHTLRPMPDKTIIVGDYHLIFEHDCGEETIDVGNIIRDATLGRKHLVYDQLHRSGTLDRLGWHKVIYTYVIDGRRGIQSASRKRI